MPIIDRLQQHATTHVIIENETVKLQQQARLPTENSKLYTTLFSNLSQYSTTNDLEKMTNIKSIDDNLHIANPTCFTKIAVWYLPMHISHLSLQSSFLSDHLYFLMHFVNYWQEHDKKVLLLIIEEDENMPGAAQKTSHLFQLSQLKYDLNRALRACYEQKRCIHVQCALSKHDNIGHTFNKNQQNVHDIFDTHVLQIVKKLSAGVNGFRTIDFQNNICYDSSVLLDSFESFVKCQPISQALVLKEKASNLAISVTADTFDKALHAPSGFTCLEQQYVLQHRHCLLFTLKVS